MPDNHYRTHSADFGGAYEAKGLERDGVLKLFSNAQMERFVGTIILTGASPVSCVLAAHEILEIVAAARHCGEAMVKYFLIPGSDAGKDLSKAKNFQGAEIPQVLVDHLWETNKDNERFDKFLRERGYSIMDNAPYKAGNTNKIAAHFYSQKTPKRTILSAPSDILQCDPTIIVDHIEIPSGHKNLVIDRLPTASQSLGAILRAYSQAELGVALNTFDDEIDPNHIQLIENGSLFNERILADIVPNLRKGFDDKEALISFNCVDCARQDSGQAIRHFISVDGKARRSNGAGEQRCRDGSTVSINIKHPSRQPIGIDQEKLINNLNEMVVFASGKFALSCILALAQQTPNTIVAFRDLPTGRNTYRDSLRVIKNGSEMRPIDATITPTFRVTQNGNPVDSPRFASGIVKSSFQLFSSDTTDTVEITI